MAFKNYIFDIDGTLVDSYEASFKSLKIALEEITGRTFTKEQIDWHFGVPTKDFFDKIGVTYDKAMFNLIDKYYKEYSIESPIYPDVIEVLETLKKNNKTLAIVTSRDRHDYEIDFPRYGLNKYFIYGVCSDDTIKHKPDPDPLLKAIDELHLNKDETIYIGDRIYDADCARSAGIKFGLALWGTDNKKIDSDYYINTPLDILKLEL